MRPVAVKDEVAVNVVRTDDQIVTPAEVGQIFEFVFPPGAADRVVGMAEQQEARLRRHCRFQLVEIPAPGAAGEHERYGRQHSSRQAGRRQEGRIHGRGREHAAVNSTTRRVEPGNQPWQPHQPVRGNLPIIMTLQILERDVDETRPGLAIAEDAVIHALLQRGDYGGRCGKVHVGDPQRQNIARAILVPLERITTTTFDRSLKVEIGRHFYLLIPIGTFNRETAGRRRFLSRSSARNPGLSEIP